MSQVFHLPDLGEGLTDAQIVEWQVAAGDEVAVDQIVAVVETAKASVDLPCPFAGRIEALHGEVGDTVMVGAPFVTVGDGTVGDGTVGDGTAGAGAASALVDAPGSADSADPAQSAAAQTYREEERAGSGNVLIGYGTSDGGGRRRRRLGRRRGSAAAASVEPVLTTAFGERGGEELLPQVPDVPGAVGVTDDGRAIRVISPLVRRLAAERGVDLAAIEPTGPGGIVTRRDVEAAPASAPARPAEPATPAPTGGAEVRIPLTGVRAAIAEKLSRSRREIPEATTWVDVDASGLLAMRDQLRASAPESGIGLFAIMARIVVAGLARHPELNASVDVQRSEIVRHGAVNLSFAVQSPRGLMVPVVHGAQAMSTRQLAAAVRDRTQAALEGRLAPAQLTGGTFTLNNYGVFGVDGSTPIINHPEAAMLGMGRIFERPWVVEGALAVRPITQLSLTFDHRVCDGGTAGGFLRFVADCVERPGTLLAEL